MTRRELGKKANKPIGFIAMILGILIFQSHEAKAELQFRTPTVNLGKILTAKTLIQRLRFVNKGKMPLEITSVRPGCGCLDPRLEKRIYQPGEVGQLEIRINTLGEPAGPHTWQTLVRYRQAGSECEIPLRIQADVIPVVNVRPAALTIFTSTSVRHEIRLSDARAKPLAIRRIVSSSAHVSGKVVADQRQANLRIQRIEVQVHKGLPQGRHHEFLQIFTNDAAYSVLKIPVSIVKQPGHRVAACPLVLMWKVAKNRPVESQIVRLRDCESQPIEVDLITCDQSAIRCSWTQGPGKMVTVRVVLDKQKLTSSRLQGAIRVLLKKPAREEISIPVEISRD